ncbi:MAG: hypothetical protein LBB98_07750 [Treponema sp.]|nr:hypothetical protein [Treponema sp.]
MSGSGEISGNSTDFYGGGVCVGKQGTFIMSDGKISGNIAGKKKDPGNSSAGGGVYVTGQFAKTGGTIYGYDANPDNNKVVDSGGNIVNNEGHAVYVKISDNPYTYYSKETTVTGNLFYNYPSTGTSSGWD